MVSNNASIVIITLLTFLVSFDDETKLMIRHGGKEADRVLKLVVGDMVTFR